MLDKNGTRQLAYVVVVDSISPIDGADRVELANVGGWRVMVHKGEFKEGDPAIYFEIDSLLDSTNPAFAFMDKKHYKVKTQRYTFGGKGLFISQGLLMSPKDFGWAGYRSTKDLNPKTTDVDSVAVKDDKGKVHYENDESRFLTKQLNITYAVASDNKRKAASADKYKLMAMRHPKLGKKWWWRKLYKSNIGKKILFLFFGKKKDSATAFPTKFPGVRITDQERCENMTWVLQDKTPFIVTQKCDGSSGTFILERKKFNHFEFYVCSRRVRQLTPYQKSFYDENYYWEVAKKYDIENKMKGWLKAHPKAWFVCWQGEVCSPQIQANPQHLKSTHLFCFHWTDSINGRRDIRDAEKDWKAMGMEVVPIEGTIVLPDDFEEFKKMAEGKYDPSVCEGRTDCDREGWVLYSTKDSKFSFKNVSRKYLLSKKD